MHYCPFYVSVGFLGRPDPMLEIHRLSTRVAYRDRPTLQRVAYMSACLAAWPLRAVHLTYLYTRMNGDAVKALSGKGYLRQALEQLGVALQHTIPPYEYYAKELFLDENRRRATDYIFDYELNRLYGFLNGHRDTQVLSNKVAFRAFCREHGLASVPVVAEFYDGRMFRIEGEELPACDLFVKQSRGSKGIGTMRWDYRGPDRYSGSDGRVLTQAELIDLLKKHSHTAPYIVQPRAITHERLRDLTTGAVVTARVVTAKMPDGEIELLGSVLKIPTGSMIGDHFVDGLFSPIDEPTGALGPASRLGLVWKRYDRHPDTGGQITGRRLSDWGDIVDLARRTHAALDNFVFIGWDIALSNDGPTLLEGNHCPSSVLMERPSNTPFGQTRFPAICLAHVHKAKDGRQTTRMPATAPQ